jgi:NodT family efflux transporter outer membrane factor (OMF) lipoprotein
MPILSNFPPGAFRLPGAIALAAVLTGCASFTEHASSVVPKPIADSAASQSLPAGGAAVAWPADAWWQVYGDRQLDRLIAQALAGSPSLAAAQARLDKAEGLLLQRGAALRPEVSANASAEDVKQSYNNGMPVDFVPQNYKVASRVALDFSYEIDFWDKNHAALAAATSELEASRADAAQARMTLATSVAAAYAELQRLFMQRDTDQASLKVRAESLQLFRERQQNGLETQAGVQQLLARRAMAEAALLATDEAIALQRNKLAALLGAGPDLGLSIERPRVDLSHRFAVPDQLPVNLLGRRADIVVARLRVEAAARQIKVARAAFYPNVNLKAYFGFQSLGMNMLTSSGSDIGGFGPAISLPIFDGGRLNGQYHAASASYDEAVAIYNSSITQALQDVADVAVSEKALAGRLSKVAEAADAAREAYRVVNNRYEGGLSTYLDVLSAQDTLLNSLQELSTLQARMFSLDVAMVRALGGGYRSTVL